MNKSIENQMEAECNSLRIRATSLDKENSFLWNRIGELKEIQKHNERLLITCKLALDALPPIADVNCVTMLGYTRQELKAAIASFEKAIAILQNL